MKRIIILSVLFFILSLAACSTSSLENPELHLSDVEFDKVTLFETGVKAHMRFTNPNDVSLKVKSGKHRLKLNSVDVGNAYHEKTFTLQPFESRVQTVNFRFSNLALMTRMQRLLGSGQLSYEVDSTIRTDRGSFDIEESGTVTGY